MGLENFDPEDNVIDFCINCDPESLEDLLGDFMLDGNVAAVDYILTNAAHLLTPEVIAAASIWGILYILQEGQPLEEGEELSEEDVLLCLMPASNTLH